MKGLQRGDRGVKGVRVKRAKALIDEQTVNLHIASGEVGQAQCKGQTNEKSFAAGKAGHRSGGACLVEVDDFQGKLVVFLPLQQVALGKFAQMTIGVMGENVERYPLGEAAEFRAVM